MKSGREGARKFARNYIYEARSGTLTDGERSYTDGSRSEVFRETAVVVFLFWCNKQEPKRFSKRSHSLLHASTTDRDDAQRDPFISTGLLDTVDVRTKDLVLHGKERCGFFPLGRRSG